MNHRRMNPLVITLTALALASSAAAQEGLGGGPTARRPVSPQVRAAAQRIADQLSLPVEELTSTTSHGGQIHTIRYGFPQITLDEVVLVPQRLDAYLLELGAQQPASSLRFVEVRDPGDGTLRARVVTRETTAQYFSANPRLMVSPSTLRALVDLAGAQSASLVEGRLAIASFTLVDPDVTDRLRHCGDDVTLVRETPATAGFFNRYARLFDQLLRAGGPEAGYSLTREPGGHVAAGRPTGPRLAPNFIEVRPSSAGGVMRGGPHAERLLALEAYGAEVLGDEGGQLARSQVRPAAWTTSAGSVEGGETPTVGVLADVDARAGLSDALERRE